MSCEHVYAECARGTRQSARGVIRVTSPRRWIILRHPFDPMKMSHPARFRGGAVSALALLMTGASLGATATGPLRPHPQNPRYFADAAGKPVYLTGTHTWNSLVDIGRGDPPERFDFDAYLALLERHHHNFIRLWAWDSTTWDSRANGKLGKTFVHNAAPLPWARTGPEFALDGRPRFDLTKFDPAYFERLRARVQAAGRRGIYVSVMLFEGWGLMHGNRRRGTSPSWAWRSHPFHPENNINGINPSRGTDGVTGDVHALKHPDVNRVQAAYIRHVVDTVNGLDNVLYEVINEGGQKDWDWWVVQTIRAHEKTKPKQHPIGLTGHGAERIDSLLASTADWISPGRNDGYGENPPAWDGRKVSLLDTDHIWGVGGNAGWVWRSFVRGHNPIFMDPYEGALLGEPGDRRWEPVRAAMGDARKLAERIDLARAQPNERLSSTTYCLAVPGREYVVYQPKPNEQFAVELAAGRYRGEWFDVGKGAWAAAGEIWTAGGRTRFVPPFSGEAVLYLTAR